MKYIREYAAGHIYPVVRLSEIELPMLVAEHKSAADTVARLRTQEFLRSVEFDIVSSRIKPPPPTDLRPLLYEESMVIMATGPFFGKRLEGGAEGVQQVLSFALPKPCSEHYDSHGGAVEVAPTFELILILRRVDHLTTRIFNPKLIEYGQYGSRPDIYLNSSVDAYVECVRTKGHRKNDVKSLKEHINRFISEDAVTKRYDIGERYFTSLHYQVEDTIPLVPTNPLLSGEIFAQRVFTFTMVNKHLYRGSVLVSY